jgi:diguanylate cyclase (GGDEF)-like protein
MNAGFASARFPLSRLLPLAGVYLLLNVAAVTLSGNSGLVSHLFIEGTVILAIVAGARLAWKTSGPLRLRWLLVLAAMLLYIVALMGPPTKEIWALLDRHYLNVFTLITIGMALRLLAISSPPEEERSHAVRSIDALLTVLICLLAIADLFLPLVDVENDVVITTHYLSFTSAFKFFVAVTATIAVAGTSSPQEYGFLRLVCIFQWLDAISIFLVNIDLFLHFNLDNTPADAVISASYLTFAILAVMPQEHLSNPVRSANIRYMVRSAMPLFLLLAVFGLAAVLVTLHLGWGLISMCAGIVLYGLRLAITQSQYMRARDRMQEQTMIDGLTQVMNRRAFDHSMEQEWTRANRSQHPFALLLIDIDYFKKLNDAHGHLIGDACLIEVAQCTSNLLGRKTDRVFRYGGEEFAVLLPGTGLRGALAVAEKIRETVPTLRQSDLAGARLTVSIGVTVYGPESFHASMRAMIESADQALYQAKREGRNRVVQAASANSLTA